MRVVWCVCVKCDVCGYVLVNSHVVCLQVHESQSNDGPGSRDVSGHLIPLLTNRRQHTVRRFSCQDSPFQPRALYFMCRVSLIPSPHSSSSTGEPGTGDSRLVYQNKIAGCGRGVRGCHCLGSSVHVQAKLVHQV